MTKPQVKLDIPAASQVASAFWLEYGVTLAEIRSRKRSPELVIARQRLMYWLYKTGKLSYQGVGLFLRRDWSTVIHGVKAHMKREGIQEIEFDAPID